MSEESSKKGMPKPVLDRDRLVVPKAFLQKREIRSEWYDLNIDQRRELSDKQQAVDKLVERKWYADQDATPSAATGAESDRPAKPDNAPALDSVRLAALEAMHRTAMMAMQAAASTELDAANRLALVALEARLTEKKWGAGNEGQKKSLRARVERAIRSKGKTAALAMTAETLSVAVERDAPIKAEEEKSADPEKALPSSTAGMLQADKQRRAEAAEAHVERAREAHQRTRAFLAQRAEAEVHARVRGSGEAGDVSSEEVGRGSKKLLTPEQIKKTMAKLERAARIAENNRTRTEILRANMAIKGDTVMRPRTSHDIKTNASGGGPLSRADAETMMSRQLAALKHQHSVRQMRVSEASEARRSAFASSRAMSLDVLSAERRARVAAASAATARVSKPSTAVVKPIGGVSRQQATLEVDLKQIMNHLDGIAKHTKNADKRNAYQTMIQQARRLHEELVSTGAAVDSATCRRIEAEGITLLNTVAVVSAGSKSLRSGKKNDPGTWHAFAGDVTEASKYGDVTPLVLVNDALKARYDDLVVQGNAGVKDYVAENPGRVSPESGCSSFDSDEAEFSSDDDAPAAGAGKAGPAAAGGGGLESGGRAAAAAYQVAIEKSDSSGRIPSSEASSVSHDKGC